MSMKIYLGGMAAHLTEWGQTANWVGAALPVSTDAVILPAGCLYGLAGVDESAVLLVGFTTELGFSQAIGSAAVYLKVDADLADLSGSGQSYFEIVNCANINVHACGVASAAGSYPLLIRGAGNTNLNFQPASAQSAAGVAALAGETAGITNVKCGNGQLVLGAGVTKTTLVISGGSVIDSSASTTTTLEAATSTGATLTQQAGAVGTLDVQGGTVIFNSPGGVTTLLHVGANGVVDFSHDLRPKTVAACTRDAGGQIYDPFGVVTWTDGITNTNCGSGGDLGNVDIGRNWKLTKGAP